MRYEFVPANNDSRLDHVGTYKRTVPVSLERMYENALDWEHLPHLHSSSFAAIKMVACGAWGWRARVTSPGGEDSLLELRLDRSCRRWITRNIEGPSQGAEIWTHVFATGERQLDLVIDFFVPNVPAPSRDKVGMAYARAYETLYDEDVWMMSERQRRLDQRLDSIRVKESTQVEVPDASALPVAVVLAGRDFLVNRFADEWVVYPAACPHQLGPLTDPINEQGEVTCPWHGYRFDVRSGRCTLGGSQQLGRVPTVAEKDGTLILTF